MNHIHDVSRHSVLDEIRQQRHKTSATLARRSFRVTMLKRALPAAALLLLAALALAPSWQSGPDANRVTYHVSQTTGTAASRMQDATYHGRDQQDQPYTVTAASAVQRGHGQVTLTAPEGDITLKSGAWLMLKSATGVYHQKRDMLDLKGGVTLYRNDGTIMTTRNSAINLRKGAASGSDPVQVTGPFGALTAQNGFSLATRGNEIIFHGPATLTLSKTQ
ncbi:LPS export ABC transporter periplasmic protein LptC [Acidocella sp.]|uniref:LPS export ABC transporter periplasmic protein LptC n=1 Tax=Acidocella sp. TaxID=50710 RepID=UPI002603D285|nr:LPS export ABC transporter periplasmic protein LptC [Acidocella sp.]